MWLATSSTGPWAGGSPCTCSWMPSTPSMPRAQRLHARVALRPRSQPRENEEDGAPARATRARGRAATASPRAGAIVAPGSGLRRHLAGRPPCSARGPAARSRRTACACPGCAARRASTGHSAFGSKTQRSATPPSTSWPTLACSVPSAAPSTRAGSAGDAPPVARDQAGAAFLAPLAAPATAAARARSRPASASAKGSVLASSSTGVWSDTSASMVPSARPRAAHRGRAAGAAAGSGACGCRSSRCRRRSGAAS